MNCIYYRVKNTVDREDYPLLDVFFKAWVDNICNNEVKVIKIAYPNYEVPDYVFLYKVECKREEDVLVIKLKGLPTEYENYLESWTH